MKYELYNEDCFETFKRIRDGSVDMALVDPPYGTTACKWDTIIPLEPMWRELKLAVKPNGAIVFTASQPFTSVLICSGLEQFRYCWVWEKSKASNFLLARKQPLKAHEDVAVFSFDTPPYYPQKVPGKPFTGEGRSKKGSKSDVVNDVPNPTFRNDNAGDRFPRSVQYFATAESEKIGALHPTQKPVALMEYLIRTYTQAGDTVLDFAMGSGTTGVACMNLGRRFIGCDNDTEHGYFQIATDRINEAYRNARFWSTETIGAQA